MFNIIKSLLGGERPEQTLLQDAQRQFCDMVDIAILLLEAMGRGVDAELMEKARELDHASNRLERSIRKTLVEHLGFELSDAPACLILMSVGKDGERVVDLSRELVTSLVQMPAPWHTRVLTHIQETEQLARRTRAAFADNDERAALEILEQERSWNRALGEVQQEVLADETLDRAAAAHTFLGLRLILRVRAHLANIASTVVLPLHRIDFARESYLREARERLTQEEDRA